MRIVGEIPHPVYKITLFHHQERYSLQIEYGLYTQIFRIRSQPGMEQPHEVLQMADQHLLDGCLDLFGRMHRLWQAQVEKRQMQAGEPEFEDIR